MLLEFTELNSQALSELVVPIYNELVRVLDYTADWREMDVRTGDGDCLTHLRAVHRG